MEVEGTEVVEEQVSEAVEAVEEHVSEEVEGGEVAEVEVAEYQPNYGYKVLGEQKEFPEWARGYVQSEDQEKNFRDVFERADGIEEIKKHRGILEDENKNFREQYVPAANKAFEADELLKQGDYDTFFKFCNIPDQKLFEYALKKLELREDPQRLQEYDQNVDMRRQNLDLQRQNEAFQSQQQNFVVQQRENELNTFLARPEILQVSGAYDSRAGSPGSFRQEVIKRGQYYAQVEQRDAPVNEVVDEIAKFAGVGMPTANLQQAPSPQGNVVTGHAQKPSLKKVRSTGQSPVKKGPTSVDELRKLAKTFDV